MLESVFLEITRECNQRCLFCSNNSCQPLPGELSTREFIDLLNDLNDMGVHDLRLYGGEPFLRSDIFQILSKARSLGMELRIYSNGTILNKEILDYLKKVQIRKLILSVDSAVPERHDQIRNVAGSFEVVVENIKTLRQHGFKVEVILTICRINKLDIMETYRLLHSLGVNDVKANFVSKVGVAKKNWDKLSLSVKEMKACVADINRANSHYYSRETSRKLCQAGTGELFIAANGDVFPCALFLDPECCTGSVKQRKIKDIWEKPQGAFANIREVIENQDFCHKCKKKDICGGGCRARAFSLSNGKLSAPDICACIFHNMEVEQ